MHEFSYTVLHTCGCRIDLEVVYKSSHFPFNNSDFSGSFVGLTDSSSLANFSNNSKKNYLKLMGNKVYNLQ